MPVQRRRAFAGRANHLILLAGFDAHVGSYASKMCREHYHNMPVRFVELPFPENESGYSASTTSHYLNICRDKIVGKRDEKSKDAPIAPISVTMLYRSISQTADERLLRMFFQYFRCVRIPPVPLQDRWWYNHTLTARAVIAAIDNCPRIEPPNRRDSVFLPLQNFRLDKAGRNLQHHYWETLRPHEYGRLDRAPLERQEVKGGGGCGRLFGWFFQDARGLTFPPNKPTEAHGVPREFSTQDTGKEIEARLGQLYRFGMPIEDGLHYDVCHSERETLDGVELTCSKEGPVSTTDRYVNIYPNDIVRK